ncbi:MAG: 16S rRNA (cytosine(1402)-N(4))-methyltransferase RsmH [Myxococcota bacterium]
MTEFVHEPVMVREVLELLGPGRCHRVVDCTVGGGGHAEALLRASSDLELLGLDRDPQALEAAQTRLAEFGPRVRLVAARFSDLGQVLSEIGWTTVDALLADLGVSSFQLDSGERGFSFRAEAPLDMRMDPTCGEPLAAVLAHVDEHELANVIFRFGEERHSRRIARAMLDERPQTTGELARLVQRLVPRSLDGIDPATRTFQGLRIWVNDELGELDALLTALPQVLAPGAVVAILSYHSLEDRAVKRALRDAMHGCICPPSLPQCLCGHKPTLRVLTRRAWVASEDEVRRNRRSRSARLRAAERIEDVS